MNDWVYHTVDDSLMANIGRTQLGIDKLCDILDFYGRC